MLARCCCAPWLPTPSTTPGWPRLTPMGSGVYCSNVVRTDCWSLQSMITLFLPSSWSPSFQFSSYSEVLLARARTSAPVADMSGEYSTVQYSTLQCSTAQYSTVSALQYSTYSIVHYSTVQYSTVPNSTVQYSTV